MLSTRPAQALAKLFAAYHEPLPLSNQQSRKLLDGLKASFRNQLDREYGQASDHAPAPAQTSGHTPQARASAASLHLKSILANPLFSYKGQPSPASPRASPSPCLPKRDPMDVFDHAVARGMMALKAATGCMVAKRRLLSAPDSGVVSTGSSETATRIVRWLRSSGVEADLKFLDDEQFIRVLAPFLVAEGLETVAWEWITRAVSDGPETSNEQRTKRASGVLAALVRTKSQPQHGNLDAAISTILEAEQRFHDSPLLPGLLVLPWRSVSWLSTVEANSRTAASEKLFDAHIATANLLPWSYPVEEAHLHLYHPTHPDHTPALHFFSDRKRLRRLIKSLHPARLDSTKLKGMGIVLWIALLGQDTAKHLAQSGKSQAADDITELLRSEMANVLIGATSPS